LRWNPATITADKCCRQSIAAVAFYLTVTSPRQSTASVMLRCRLRCGYCDSRNIDAVCIVDQEAYGGTADRQPA
jgi:hypothetical protein